MLPMFKTKFSPNCVCSSRAWQDLLSSGRCIGEFEEYLSLTCLLDHPSLPQFFALSLVIPGVGWKYRSNLSGSRERRPATEV